MTLAGFMRGGGGSTNMRLSRRHCWLAGRVAHQQQRQAIQQQALQFVSAAAAAGPPRLERVEGALRGASPCLLLPTRPLSQIDEDLVQSVGHSDRSS